MRIERLHLDRYGAFSDTWLDFRDATVKLHVVCGPNEAGKSTVRTAVSDLLYGIPVRSQVGFRHGNNALRIGAELRASDGTTLAVRRRKGNGQTLLTAGSTETGLPEGALQPFLRGATRDDFETMFALDHVGLRRGGQRMLEDGGDLARSLVEAGTGLAEVGAALNGFAKELEEIGDLARRSSGKPIWKRLDELEKARDDARQAALRVEDWKAAEERLAEAKRRRGEHAASLLEIRQRRSRLQRVRRVAPLIRRLQEARDRLATLSGLPLLPPGFDDLWQQAERERARTADRLFQASEAVDAAQARRDEIESPDAVLALEAEITSLHGQISLVRKAIADAEAARADVYKQTDALRGHVRDLGLEGEIGEIATRVPLVSEATRLRDLVDAALEADTASRSAAGDLEAARDQYRIALAGADALPALLDASAAEEFVADLPKISDLLGRVAAARSSADNVERQLRTALTALGRWTGDADDLEACAFPDNEVVQRHEAALRSAGQALLAAELEVRRLAGECAREEAELAAIVSSGGALPTRAAVDEVRGRRDGLWAAIRAVRIEGLEPSPEQAEALVEGGPDSLEALTRDADRLADRRMDEAARVERHETASVKVARLRAELRVAEAARDGAASLNEDACAAWEAAWAGSGVSPLKPEDMRSWLQRRDAVLRVLKEHREKASALELVEQEVVRTRTVLARAAETLGAEVREDAAITDLHALVTARIRQASASAEKRRAAEAQVIAEAGRVANAEAKASKAAVAADERRAEMAAAMPGLGLGSDASPRQASAVLSAWEGIRQHAEALRAAQSRLARSEDTLDAFRARVGTVAGQLGAEGLPADPMAMPVETSEALMKLLSAARDAETRATAARKALSEAREDLRKAAILRDTAETECARLRGIAGVTADAEVPSISQQVTAAGKLQEEAGRTETDLLAGSDGLSVAELEAEVLAIPPDQAAAELLALDTEEVRSQQELEEALRQETEARRTLDGFLARRAAAADVHEAAIAAQEAAALAERWAVVTAAKAMLERALELYRAENQDPMLLRGSEIFARLAGTGTNPFVRLEASYPEGGQPHLQGIRADGSPCDVEGMSEGTRDQLYLALRLAAVERRIATEEPLPFLADDLFVTTDEERLERGLSVLAELGERTQVVLFTHHRHVVECAQRLPGIALHFLVRDAVHPVAVATA